MQLPGWYVWDTIELAGGGAALLASPVAAGSLVPAWELDVLRWNGSSFVSIQHAAGSCPRCSRTPRPRAAIRPSAASTARMSSAPGGARTFSWSTRRPAAVRAARRG